MKIKSTITESELRNDLPNSRTYHFFVEGHPYTIHVTYDNSILREVYLSTPGEEYDMWSFRANDFNDISYYKVEDRNIKRYKDGVLDRIYNLDTLALESDGRRYNIIPLSEDDLFPGVNKIEMDLRKTLQDFHKVRSDIIISDSLLFLILGYEEMRMGKNDTENK